ncbi:MAG: HD domain-containing phosphohydrolase [Phycisphaerae bacterium]
MGSTPGSPGTGLRVHQFVVGAAPVAAYLAGWSPPVWGALGLSLAAVVSVRFAFVARVYDRFCPSADEPQSGFHPGLHRFDEGLRTAFFALGLGLLVAGSAFGWLPILAASATAILEGATGFVVTAIPYAALKAAAWRAVGRPLASVLSSSEEGNIKCVVVRCLGRAAYPRCRWCRVPSIRWCCGLQASLLLLLVIVFLLNASLGPWETKILVVMSIVAVAALGLAINRSTDDLVEALEDSRREEQRKVDRCDLLRRLATTETVESASEEAIQHLMEWVGARRMSVMVARDRMLRIVASCGIPREVAEAVAVPLSDRICGQVFSTGRAVVLEDPVRQMPESALGLEGKGASASLPLVSAPMGANGQKVGCINATDKPGGAFSPADLAELEFVAEAAGIMLGTLAARHDLERANYDTIRALALAVEAKDPYTHGHSLRVQAWATAVARKLGLDEDHIQTLANAAELHDVGKLAIPDRILRAERSLTEDEWALVRQHPQRGVQMIQHIGFLRSTLEIILYHHERVDGRGYPEGRAGEAIPLGARILAVVDSYDAMTSLRPYRGAMTHEAAAAELRRCTGTQFDAVCVETFLGLLSDVETAPVETAVRAGALPPGRSDRPRRKPPAARAAR